MQCHASHWALGRSASRTWDTSPTQPAEQAYNKHATAPDPATKPLPIIQKLKSLHSMDSMIFIHTSAKQNWHSGRGSMQPASSAWMELAPHKATGSEDAPRHATEATSHTRLGGSLFATQQAAVTVFSLIALQKSAHGSELPSSHLPSFRAGSWPWGTSEVLDCARRWCHMRGHQFVQPLSTAVD